jgi:hypothetical protein
MSSIKPPDGRGAGAGLPVSPEQGAGATGPAGADFREALSRAEKPAAGEAAAAAGTAPASQAAATDPLAELAGLVRSGALTPDAALDRLVERALGGVARGLDDAQRAELASVLRTALEADPALQALRDGLGR